MNGGKHTPGPWSYRSAQHDDWGVVRAGRFFICQAKDPRFMDTEYLAQCRESGRDPWEANARLIAAAPDLLAALKRFRTKVYNAALGSGMDHEWATEACSVADAAIAKAEGGAA